MPRAFNTAGPCKADIHYMLPPLARLPNLERWIDQLNYFVIHAPRQVGKTTAMLELAQQLTQTGRYTAIMLSVEVGQPFSEEIGAAEQAILAAWQSSIQLRLPAPLQPSDWGPAPAGQGILNALKTWAVQSSRPLVILIDEIDSLRDQALISVLRQLRYGYTDRPRGFPQSVGLIGLRDVRDYKVASGGSTRLTTASPFNIKAESLTLRDFTQAEIAELYQQHTDDTGQIFTPEAIERVFDLTQGQPWLVNAIARQLTEVITPNPSTPIVVEMVEQAKEILIQRRDTHLDSLDEKLLDPRVQAIIEPILAGLTLGNVPKDDRQYVVDLGILKRDAAGGLTIANPIYREVLPRALAQAPQDTLPSLHPNWLTPQGDLDLDALRDSFLDFWRQHGEPLLGSTAYHEIAPHLVLMAFLHRVLNGGGQLEREYAIGRDRMDLYLRYGTIALGIELKVWRDGKADPLPQGLQQLEKYLARLGVTEGWLVIFDRRSQAVDLGDRLSHHTTTTPQGYSVTVIRA